MREHRSISILQLAVLLSCFVGSVARGEDVSPPSRPDSYAQHESQARKHAGQGRYAAAVKEYRAAYALRQSPALLFNIGVCYQRLENYAEAVGYYDQYLRKEPKPREEIIKELEALLAQMKAISEDVQHKKKEVVERLCSFSVGSASCPKPASSGPSYVVAREVPQPQGPVTQTSPPNEGGSTGLGQTGTGNPQLSPQQRNSDAPGQSTERPLYKKAWFWGVVGGGVVLASVIIGVSVYEARPKNVPLPMGVTVLGLQF